MRGIISVRHGFTLSRVYPALSLLEMLRKIFCEGCYPSQTQLHALPCDEHGFAWYLQHSPMSRTGVVANVVVRTFDSMGKPVMKLAGVVEVITPTVDTKGVNVTITCGRIVSAVTPTMWEAYELIKTHWALNQ